MGGFTPGFRGNRDLLVFGGVWARREILGPNRKKFGPEKTKKPVELFFKKYVFVKNGAIFFRIRPLVHPIGAVHTEKI